jgi:hypothetical protein
VEAEYAPASRYRHCGTQEREVLEGQMARASRADKAARRELLGLLAGELRRPGAPGQRVACRLVRPPFTAGWLTVRARHRKALRVHCVSAGAAAAFLTSGGDLIGAADLAAAARAITAAGSGPGR